MNTLTELSQRLDDKGILGIFIKPWGFLTDRSFQADVNSMKI